MRVVLADSIDWSGTKYEFGDIVYAGPALGAAVKTSDGQVLGLGMGEGIDKFISDLEALISDRENLGRSLTIADEERSKAIRELVGLKEEIAHRPTPAAGFTITELSDAIVAVVKAVKE